MMHRFNSESRSGLQGPNPAADAGIGRRAITRLKVPGDSRGLSRLRLRSVAVVFRLALPTALGFLLLTTGCESVSRTKEKVPVVAKWGRFEQVFESDLAYSNPLQEVRLTVLFTSPLGSTQQVDGYWDGGMAWRVRFSPDQPGHWTFKTACSDVRNPGLHGRTGEFLCTAATGQTRFQRHGPVRVARDHRHFEHADGTPFFWIADTAWNGARVAAPKNWEVYALTRAFQKFSVAQWAVAPGLGAHLEPAFTGMERISINPEFFKHLDAKVTILSRAGLLSAIVPLLELGSAADREACLPEDQAILLLRYIVARWGAEPVVWLLAFDGGNQGWNVARWKRIGQAVFAEGSHAPVIVFPGETSWVLDELRDQTWVDAFGCQSMTDFTDDALKWTFVGPFAREWMKEPARPLIPFVPHENAARLQSEIRFSADDVRRAVYWSLLLTVPAGVSYGAQGVANWDTTLPPADADSEVPDVPAWRKALFLPAARQMTYLAELMGSVDFWKLRPRPETIATQPGDVSVPRFIAATGMDTKALALVYLPEDRSVDIIPNVMPASALVSWFNPRTGEKTATVALASGATCPLPTPNPGDWLLLMMAEGTERP